MNSSFAIPGHDYSPVSNYYRSFCHFDSSAGRTAHQTVRYKSGAQSLGEWWKLNGIDDVSFSSHRFRCKFDFSAGRITRESVRFKFVVKSLGDRWKLNKIDANAVQGRVNSWLMRTQNFLNEVTSPLVKDGHIQKPNPENALNDLDVEDLLAAEQTIESRTSNRNFSWAAIVSIEQFSRMNGSTGKNMQKVFEDLVPQSISNDARNLVEYCCFRFLSRNTCDVHPSLKEPAFQKLIFITMLAWENPYCEENVSLTDVSRKVSSQDKLVREEAFVRIAPAIAGLAEHVTVHMLFRALAGEDGGISLSMWSMFIDELLKVHERMKSYQICECDQFFKETVLCIGSSRKQPVLKWKNNIAWPGKLTLTDKALYFKAIGLIGQQNAIRLDLTNHGSCVDKTRVGPFGSVIFDSAVSVSSGLESERWVLEFVDLGSEMRRDVWHALISEVISLYKFIREYGPEDGDQLVCHVYGAEKGNERAVTSGIHSIARLQALQLVRKLLDDPIKLVPFSYLRNAPYGDIVCQTLAVNYWGGQLMTEFPVDTKHSEMRDINNHVLDLDGSVYLRNWKKSLSWFSTPSIVFWKTASIRPVIILSKNLVVGDMNIVERAALTCKHKSLVAENTQATIDAAMLKGIPSNIDLFKELMLPLSLVAKKFEKLTHWEEPHLTLCFLAFAYTIIFRNLLLYVFPTSLMVIAAIMLLLKGLKEQGRLGKSFGKLTIIDQPPSNTIQKILAIKEAIDDLENILQHLNVVLLKIRTIAISGQPQITTEVAVMLLICGAILLTVPFKYVMACLLFDLFTRELGFRREIVAKIMRFLKERWDTVPAAPVVVLPFKNEGTGVEINGKTKKQLKRNGKL